MTELYPLLTVENVKYWYWDRDPQMSGHDIAKEVGCYFQKVYKFMRKYNIPIRSYRDASKVLFQDPKKYKQFLKAKTSPDYLRKQSESHKQLWENNPELRLQRSELLKNFYKTKLSDAQKVVLFLLRDKNGKFTRELVELSSLKKVFFYHQLSTLLNRGLISIVKKHDYKANPKVKYSQYYITQEGLEILNDNLTKERFDFYDLIDKVKNKQIEHPELVESNKNFLGKNQKIILKTLSYGKSYFTKELYQLTELKKIEKSLLTLYKRGFVKRQKKFNSNLTGNNKRAYIYSLTEKGFELINKIL